MRTNKHKDAIGTHLASVYSSVSVKLPEYRVKNTAVDAKNGNNFKVYFNIEFILYYLFLIKI